MLIFIDICSKEDGRIAMNKFLTFFILSLSLFLTVNAGASNNDSEEYLIQKGDTLWVLRLWRLKTGVITPFNMRGISDYSIIWADLFRF